MIFFIKSKNKIATDTQLFQIQGYPNDLNVLRQLGIFPIDYNYPKYNAEEQALIPDGELVLETRIDGDWYVQDFKVVELNEEAKAEIQNRKKENAFSLLRAERNSKLEEYDKKISQFNRELRLADDDYKKADIVELIDAWDKYATQLCNLPEHEDAPWVGGTIPWPEMPA